MKRSQDSFPPLLQTDRHVSSSSPWFLQDKIETVVLLTRKRKSKDYKVEIEIPIDVDGSKSYAEKKSTYQNIKKFIKAKYGVNTHTKDIAEVKRDCGVEMRLNYNLLKKENP